MELFIGIAIIILGGMGSLWYKIGKVETEVKQHNRILGQIQKALEILMTRSR